MTTRIGRGAIALAVGALLLAACSPGSTVPERTRTGMDTLWSNIEANHATEATCTAWALSRDTVLVSIVQGFYDREGFNPDRPTIISVMDARCSGVEPTLTPPA